MEQFWKSLIFLGDSVTNGYFDHLGGGWAQRLLLKLQDEKPYTYYVRNFAVSGDCTPDCLSRFRSQVAASPGDFLFIMCGVNDIARYGTRESPHYIKEETRMTAWKKLLSEACQIYADIFVISMLPVVEDRCPARTDDNGNQQYYRNDDIVTYNMVIRDLCTKHDVRFLDLYTQAQHTNFTTMLFDDVHPNEKGHEWIANQVWEQTKDRLLTK